MFAFKGFILKEGVGVGLLFTCKGSSGDEEWDVLGVSGDDGDGTMLCMLCIC